MKTQKGITLIALIITIIVMLILVGISVSAAINTGLFKTASEVSKNTQGEKTNEQRISKGEVNIDNKYIDIKEYAQGLGGGVEISVPSELKIGDLIEYTPTQGQTYDASVYAGCSGTFETDMDNTVEWKVIGIEGNKIEIIPKAVSTTELTLTGAHGWNNSINVMDDACAAIYGNTTSDKYIATARSITMDDINEITGFTPPDSYEISLEEYYGYSQYYYPTEYLKDLGINDFTETNGYAVYDLTTLEASTYSYSPEYDDYITEGHSFYEWFDFEYHLVATRYFEDDSAEPGFAIAKYGDSDLGCPTGGYSFFLLVGSEKEFSDAVRPVVTLTLKSVPELKNGVWKF